MRFEKRYVVVSRRVQDEQGDLATLSEEGAVGIRVIKSFGRSEHVAEQYERAARQLHATSMDKVRLSARFWSFLEVIPNLAVVVVLLLGSIGVGRGYLTPGELVAFITLMLSLVWPVSSLGVILAMSQEAMTASARILEIFDTEPDIVSGTQVIEQPRGHLRFEHVDFAFPDALGEPVLRDVNLDVRPGETVALVGATGSGKTILTALVPRLYDVTGGRVTIDGVDVRDLRLGHLRGLVATAFEEPTLFSMSARENLILGRPDATEEEMPSRPRRRPGRLRPRPAVGPRDPHRGAGHGALRRPAAAARARARGARPAAGAGPRRHALRARRAHREAGGGGAATRARLDHRAGGRPPRLDGAARRPGRAAPGRHHHPRRRPPRAAGHGAGVPRPAGRRGETETEERERMSTARAPPRADHAGPRGPLDWRGTRRSTTRRPRSGSPPARLGGGSRRLLARAARAVPAALQVLMVVVVVENAARLSIPYLVKVGIDSGIPPIRGPATWGRCCWSTGWCSSSTLTQAVARQLFLVRAGRIGQDVLLRAPPARVPPLPGCSARPSTTATRRGG